MDVHVEMEDPYQYSNGQDEGLHATECVLNERSESARGVGKGKDSCNWCWSDGDDSHDAWILALLGA